MALVQLIMTITLIAAVIFYFYRRSKKLKEMEMEERLRDLFK
jgi:cbb3-type cytochrome oxidase subunit 3